MDSIKRLARHAIYFFAIRKLNDMAAENSQRIEGEPNLSEETKLKLMKEYNVCATASSWLLD